MRNRTSHMAVVAVIAVPAVLLALSLAPAPAGAAEDWKGEPDTNGYDLGGLGGLAIHAGNAGFAMLGTVSKKIVPKGFASDINNSVSLETQLGPIFIAHTTVFSYSLHLRWDFQRDPKWFFYALGGVGGLIAGD